MNDEPTEDPGASSLRQNKAEGISPGEILHEGRLAHDYSVEDLCTQTKLNIKTVKALENNDFQALSQPVFARGYYRQCAKVLDLDINRLMTAYRAWAGEPATPRVDHRAVGGGTIPQDVTPGGFRFRGLLILLAVAVVVIAAIVFFVPSNSMPGMGSGASDPNGQAATLALNPTDDNSVNRNSAPANDSVDNRPDQSAPDVADDSSDPARTGQKAGGRNVNQSLGIESSNGSHEATQGAGSDDNDSRSTSDVASNRLVLTFTKRSWVRVTDANGNRMASGIFESGARKTFNGTPPYKIKLGFAPGVKVSIGGRSVDVASRTGGAGVAHLTVDAPHNDG